MDSIKPGDEVRLFITARRWRETQPVGGYPGTVTKIARKYATAMFESVGAHGWEVTFDMETGLVRADTVGMRVRTPGQVERDERRKEALFLLKNHGIEFGFGRERSLTLEQVEALAEVVKRWEQEG